MNEDLRKQLLAMKGKSGSSHTQKLKKLVEKQGWPTISEVGEDGAEAAWSVVLRASDDLAFQKRCLELMKDAYQQGEIPGSHYAHLYDRVCVSEGRAQLYGTQFVVKKNGDYAPYDISDVDRVNERRSDMGMESYEEEVERLEED